MAAFAIVRSSGRFLKSVNGLFLMVLAIPVQATIIPVYLIIIRLKLYDSLLAIILPSIAFAIPLSVLVLSNFIRDVPKELFESMRVDGASEWTTLWRLAFPSTRMDSKSSFGTSRMKFAMTSTDNGIANAIDGKMIAMRLSYSFSRMMIK